MNHISDYRRSTTPSPAVLVPPIPVTDGELLMRFARHGDDAAFTQLVEKHGRLVWTVCWQVLRQHHEIEDAFQATFFILAKRARSIRSCDSLCGWLYRVAYRTALRSRMSARRKPLVELVNDELSTLDEKLKGIEQHEQRAALMEELHSLPEQYQMPLVLCYLEGKSRRAAAEELGTTIESVKGRLTRGRQLLRHRLIRRGVSLSFAMAAMTIPVKSATAAMTPSLVGLTVAGATTWSALTAKVASTVTTISTNVSTLAHQGTVAMTIASYAKPAIVAIALLTGVSATVAVDSPGKEAAAAGGDTVSLAIAADATAGEDIQITAAEGEAGVTIAPIETAQVDGKRQEVTVAEDGTLTINGGTIRTEKNPKKKGGTITLADGGTINLADGDLRIGQKKGTLMIDGGEIAIASPESPVAPVALAAPARIVKGDQFIEVHGPAEVSKPRKPAPARVPAQIQFRAAPTPPDMLIAAPTPVEPWPMMEQFNFEIDHKVNIELQLKIAELEAQVSQLQLESKELEIEAFDHVEEKRAELLQQSRKRLAMAEAEKLKIGIEKQHAQIEELRKAIEGQAQDIGEKAKKAAKAAGEDAKGAAKEAGEQAKMAGKIAAEEARAAAEQAREVIIHKAAIAQQAAQAQAGAMHYEPSGSGAYKLAPRFTDIGSASELRPGSRIRIQARGVDPESPLDGVFVVEPMGTVALGVTYGRVNIEGLSVIDAEEAILQHLSQDWESPKVQVVFEEAKNR
jgi:RNA polymerase sigma factor (sigma-70 family)